MTFDSISREHTLSSDWDFFDFEPGRQMMPAILSFEQMVESERLCIQSDELDKHEWEVIELSDSSDSVVEKDKDFIVIQDNEETAGKVLSAAKASRCSKKREAVDGKAEILLRKRQKNKESSARSRQKRAEYVRNLENEVQDLKTQAEWLRIFIKDMLPGLAFVDQFPEMKF